LVVPVHVSELLNAASETSAEKNPSESAEGKIHSRSFRFSIGWMDCTFISI
jgi:hypothetical protein